MTERPQLPLPSGLPGKVICIGLNYHDHAREAGLDVPDRPVTFAKWPSALVGPGVPIELPSASAEIDYEAEVAIVLGKRCVDVAPEQAWDHVAGLTCFNDVTARDIQFSEAQWTRSKSFDTFGPIGPEVVAPDRLPDPDQLRVRCLLNGDVVQDSPTEDMIFPMPEIVSFVSTATTLWPGDVIATGTPAGVGFVKDPPRLLQEGDEVTVEIEGIGALSNSVVAR